MTKLSINAGPDLSCAAIPVRTKMPVPMMHPTPRLVSATGPSTRRRRCSPFISSRSTSSDLVRNSWFAIVPDSPPEWAPSLYPLRFHTNTKHQIALRAEGVDLSALQSSAIVDVDRFPLGEHVQRG